MTLRRFARRHTNREQHPAPSDAWPKDVVPKAGCAWTPTESGLVVGRSGREPVRCLLRLPRGNFGFKLLVCVLDPFAEEQKHLVDRALTHPAPVSGVDDAGVLRGV